MLGYTLKFNHMEIMFGLVILICYHMEEGKVPSSINGSQDAILPTPIGILVNQTIQGTIKIIQQCIQILANGLTGLLKIKLTAAVSTTRL